MKNLINISNKVENLNEVFSPIKSVKLKNFPLENKKSENHKRKRTKFAYNCENMK